jgi:hypothetical protein
MRFIILAILFSGLLTNSFASTDSLIIKGRILNLSGRLYRQASFINFSRNNILQPQSELSKQAPLEADGSFRVSLPMLFAQEEIYMDYGGKAFTTFLGSPGTVEITFNGDSIAKAKKLFFFSGVNADANNLYAQYLAIENQRFAANRALGADFFRSFWERSPEEVKSLAKRRAEIRISAAESAASSSVPSPTLAKWIKSVADDEQMQFRYEHAMSSDYALAGDMKDSLVRLAAPPLTGQRVIWASRFGSYADVITESRKMANPNRANSLPVRLMAALIRDNTRGLSSADRLRLNQINQNGLAEKGELDFMNGLFAKNEMTLNLLFNFERESRIYGETFDSTAAEFLKTRYLAKNFYKFTYPQQLILNKHIQSRTHIPSFKQSLDEIVALEVRDSSDIQKILNVKSLKAIPTEVLPGYYLSASNDRGTSWFNQIADYYKGKTIYVTKWNLDDGRSRDELDFMPILQSSVPEDVVFLYIHMADEGLQVTEPLLKQYIVRHKLKGTHLFMNNEQAMDLLFRLNPLDPGTFSVIRPNGKFFAKNAPAPSAREKAVQAVLEAAR